MRIKVYSFLIFIFFISSYTSTEANGKRSFHFHNLNDLYGLSIREANSVCSDLNGFIWISSKMGVIRYSSNDIKTYQIPYESVNVVTTKLNFNKGHLYAYTNNGQIFSYDPLQDRFVLIVNIAKELRYNYLTVSKMLVDDNNRLWIGTTAGLFSYDHGIGLRSHVPNGYIYHMDWYEDGKLLLAVNIGDLTIFDLTDYSTELLFRLPEDRLRSLSYLYYDKLESKVWIGSMEEGLYLLKTIPEKELIKINSIPNQPILSIQSCVDSTLLIGIDGQGVWQINKDNFELLSVMKEDANNPNSLRGNGVYDIYCAPDNRVWVCTYSGGVSFFDISDSELEMISHVVNDDNSLVNNNVNSVLEDKNNNIWFATNNGVSVLNVRSNKWSTFFHNKEKDAQVFLKLFEDSKGRIWASTYSSGIYILNKYNGKVIKRLSHEYTPGDFNGDFVFDIFEDEDKNVWLGGVRGDLMSYNIEADTFRSYVELAIYVIIPYGKEKLLLGTVDGLQVFDKNSGEVEMLLKGIYPNDLCIDKSNIWMATGGDGVVRYNVTDKSVKKFTVDDGLPSNYVNSIVFTNGFFWMGTERGLCKLNKEDLSIQSFNSMLYFGQVSFNQKCHCILKNGKLLMGANKGALMFNPELLSLTPEKGNIYIQDISVSGRSIRDISELKPQVPIDKLKDLSLKYFQNTIGLELIPIGVSSQGVKFTWKMEGLDEQWSKPIDNKILSYSNIPPGDYTLKIRMLDNSVSQVIAEREVRLNMIPPYWKTWWFRLVVVTFVIGITIVVLFYYINHLNKVHSEEKIRFFVNTAHDMRTSLTLINGPIEELNKESGLSNKGHHYLHLATEQTHRLLKVVTQLMDFQKSDIGKEKLSLTKIDIVKMVSDRVMMFESFAGNNNIKLHFHTNVPQFHTSVDETMIEKVVDNLISNAVKYSHVGTKVQVNLECLSAKWILEVKDQGIGISKKAQRQLFKEYYRAENVVNSKIVGSGIGLLLVKNYINLHGGKISCSSQLNDGSTFQVVVPILNLETSTEPHVNVKNESVDTSQKQKTNIVALNDNEEQDLTRMKILVVEDNEYLREFLNSSLDEQFDIYLAEDGEQAWKAINELTPDLVVSDIVMPKMDGFELCQKIKVTYETSHLPVILLTSLAGKAEQLHGLGLGADDYLTKPFDISLLNQRIKTLVKNREIIREKALKLIRRDEDKDVTILENELNDKFLKKMIDVVHENISNAKFAKNDFAVAMNVSPSLLYKKVKSLTDQSPTDFIKTIRLNHSVELLKSKKYTITEVSELCGFASVGYFSTVFRKHYGKSPTQLNE